jgi:energy-coupling factor transport system ATP-binding protein
VIRRAGYRLGKTVIEDIKFSLSEGELLLIVGPSGSGKTTLLLAMTGVLNNLLNGFVDGYVDLFGINPLTPEGFTKVPKVVGVVLQDPEKQISMPTPADEVVFTLENLGFKEVESLVLNALKRVGLEGKATTPTEYLSGGEKKRLCIAASIVHDPKLVIFDEPTANLDPWGVSEVIKYINGLRGEGRAVIVIEHKARYFTKFSDKFLLISNGRQVMYLEGRDSLKNYLSMVKSLEDYGVDIYEPKLVRTSENVLCREVVLEVRDLWFRYLPGKNYVLRGVNLSLCSGDVGVIVGPNGAGKTTLLKVIAGFYRPEKGSIRLLGRDVMRVKKFINGREVFYVPQEPDYMFIHSRVLDELKVGIGSLDEVLGGEAWIKDLLDESPYRLSHGQRRWLAYTIAKLYNPKVILFDEPTAGLDLTLLKRYVGWVKEVTSQGKTVLIATHDVRLLHELATRTFIIEDGHLREVGVVEAIKYLEDPLRWSDD